MKQHISMFIRTTKNAFLLVCLLVLLQSCSTNYQFATSQVVPAAEGTVKVKKDDNNNYSIKMHLKRLADPARLSPSKALYVAWMVTEKGESVNIGQINTSNSFFSSMLESSLTTVIAEKPTGFFITAENENTVTYPGGVVVLRTK